MPTGRERVFPFYVLCDVSQSMWDPSFQPPGQRVLPFRVLRAAIANLVFRLNVNATVADAVMIGVVAFADAVQVYLPLTRPRDVDTLPELQRGYRTDYARAFAQLAAMISADCDHLARSFDLKRPAVFFLTDGQPYVDSGPQDERVWTRPLDQLLSPAFPWRPQIVAFGLGRADEDTLCRVATTQGGVPLAFTADDADSVAALLDGIIRTLFVSIGDSVAWGDLVIEPPPGMRRARPSRVTGR